MYAIPKFMTKLGNILAVDIPRNMTLASFIKSQEEKAQIHLSKQGEIDSRLKAVEDQLCELHNQVSCMTRMLRESHQMNQLLCHHFCPHQVSNGIIQLPQVLVAQGQDRTNNDDRHVFLSRNR